MDILRLCSILAMTPFIFFHTVFIDPKIPKKYSFPAIYVLETDLSSKKIPEELAKMCFLAASYLTDPLCKSYEFFLYYQIVDVMHPTDPPILRLARKTFLWSGIITCCPIAVITTPFAIILRFLGLKIQPTPFIYLDGRNEDKIISDKKKFSILSWNICCIGAGYSIHEGGVTPWLTRIGNVIEKIIETNADITCLYEVFDVQTSFKLYKELKKQGYNHFYFNMGAKPIGVSSGIFVASKYKVGSPEFLPFSQEMLSRRAKRSGKGVFTFDIENAAAPFARIFTTHMQHSEQPQFPTTEEVKARNMQMELILKKIPEITNRCVVVTGDLNLDDQEYKNSYWNCYFKKKTAYKDSCRFTNKTTPKSPPRTWGGDGFFAGFTKKSISAPLNLDHSMIFKKSARSIHTRLIETKFDSNRFQEDALSDHAGLFSEIRLNN